MKYPRYIVKAIMEAKNIEASYEKTMHYISNLTKDEVFKILVDYNRDVKDLDIEIKYWIRDVYKVELI